MNFANVSNLSINDSEVMRITCGDSVLYQWSIDSIPVNPDFQSISCSFRSSIVDVGKVATLTVAVPKNFNPSSAILIDDRGIIRREFKRTNINTNNTARDFVGVMFSPLESDRGERTYMAYVLDGDGKRTANFVSDTITVR